MSKRKNNILAFLGIVIVGALAVIAALPTGPNINLNHIKINYQREIKAHLGLDLQGGSELTYEADLSKIQEKDYESAMSGLRDVIEKRVNAFGVSEPVVQTVVAGGSHRLIVQLPGVQDVNAAIASIGETPLLEFYEVTTIPEDLRKQMGENAQSEQFTPTELTGQYLKYAEVVFDQQTSEPIVSIEFNEQGAKLFADITKRNIGKPVAIVLDGSVVSAPRVNNEITGGKAQITGNFSIDEAKELAKRLRTGALPVPIHLISQSTVGPTLGKESIQKSVIAALIGMAVVGLFMIGNYRLPGLIAVCSLGLYAVIVLALFKLIPVVLTLAGIAGFILSVGIAVDANVLVFERIREELAKGKQLKLALEDGFQEAWPSIRDSNISGLITCGILLWFGSSVVQGFALTLAIGILISLFTAIVVTRTFMRLTIGSRVEKHLWLIGPALTKIEKEKM